MADPNKPRLTDAQKKKNHILSEKKRRDAIRLEFDRLADLVPGMEGQGRSEALLLSATVDFIRHQNDRTKELKEVAKERGFSEEEVDGLLEEAIRTVDARKGEGDASRGSMGSEGGGAGGNGAR
ncbi:hypothetical protein B0A50_00805 [Salinomyces thailandicus]|uniref:BHLH domain-containing protein n=1 Tax=Salinomyces thailandicus TaxID=706561 RepID=A0A4U0UEG7_9PEZI|nr:hypothetical protein B0A50_00805 [Salinomyces thailandica]